MTEMPKAIVQPARIPPVRDEYVRDTVASRNFGVVEKPLTRWGRLYNQGWLRKTFIIAVIAVAWESYAALSRQRSARADLECDA